MVNLNGNIPNINLGLSAGVVALMIFTIIVGGYYITETRTIAEQTKITSDEQNNKLTTFIKNWEKRASVDNKVGNITQHRLVGLTENISTTLNLTHEQEIQLINLARNQTKILDTQIENEKNIIDTENHVIGNLTDHRIIANQTRDIQLKAINQTKELVKFLSDNFGEQSGYLEKEKFQYNQANETAQAIKENNQLLKQMVSALNITNTTQTEQNKNATINDKTVQQILDILNKTQ